MNKAQAKTVRAILLQNRKWVLEMSGGDTCGWCGISAFRVNHFLRVHGFNPKLTLVDVEEEGHCFNHLDGMILDVTADQFGMSKLVMKPRKLFKKHERFWFWGWDNDNYESFEVITDFKTCMKRLKSWGNQSPQEAFAGTPLLEGVV